MSRVILYLLSAFPLKLIRRAVAGAGVEGVCSEGWRGARTTVILLKIISVSQDGAGEEVYLCRNSTLGIITDSSLGMSKVVSLETDKLSPHKFKSI